MAFEREKSNREAAERREESKRAKDRERQDAALQRATGALESARQEPMRCPSVSVL